MLGDKLTDLLEIKKMKPGTLARLTGVSKSTIYGIIRRNNKSVDFSIMEKIADALGVPIEYFFDRQGRSDIPHGFDPIPSMISLPVLGQIACGEPILAEQNVEDHVLVPITTRADFCLICRGDSMIDARIHDGDIAFIRSQPVVEDGEIAAVRIGDECTLKRFQRVGNTVYLHACNTRYLPLVYTGERLNEIAIVGKLVGFMSYDVR